MSLNLKKIFIFIPITWLLLVSINHLNPNSKFSLYRLDFERYKEAYSSLAQSASEAKTRLEKWLAARPNEHLLFGLNTTNYLCVGVISKKRIGSGDNYVKPALMSIMTRVAFQRQDKIRLVAFNTEPIPSHNGHLLDFEPLIQIVNLTSGLKGHKSKVIETLDYSYCMKYFINLKCKYSLFVEDDALFGSNWFEIFDKEIGNVQNSRKWLMIKLFTGIVFFNNDWMQLKYTRVILKVFFSSVVLTLVEILFFKLFFKHVFKFNVFVLLINAGFQACFLNSSSTAPFGSGLRVQRTGFGSVAVLYPIQHLVPLSQYLEDTVLNYVHKRSHFVEPKDILMEIYRREKGLDEMILEPSLVQHTGFYSSLEQKNSTYKNFQKMFKSLTFADDFRKIEFDWK